MALVGSLVASLSANTSDFEQGMRRGQDALTRLQGGMRQTAQTSEQTSDSMTRQARMVSEAFGSIRQSILATAAAALSIRAIGAAMAQSVQAALRVESINSTFKAITGSAQGAADAMTFVRTEANRLGADVFTLADSYKQLLSASQGTSLAGEGIKNVFLGIAEAARVLGLSQEDLAGAMRPIAQILNQQAFQADEFKNEFGSRIPGALQLLLQATNGAVKTQQELSKAMEDGKLKGEVVFDIISNLGEVLRSKYANAAQEASQGTAAAFQRLETSVKELSVAFGQLLAPALAESAKALQSFMTIAQGAGASFGETFTFAIRQATSVVIGLTGGVIVLGKYLAALGAGLAFGAEAWQAGWEDVQKTFSDIADLQTKIVSGGFAALPQAPAPPRQPHLRPITLGTGKEDEDKEGKRRGMTEIERAAQAALRERANLEKQIQDDFDRARLTEREYAQLKLEQAGFEKDRIANLMETVDLTKALKDLQEEDKRRAQERKSLEDDLLQKYQEQTLTERQRLQLTLDRLKYDDQRQQSLLAQFDLTQQLRREEEAATQAAAEHAQTIQSLMGRLEPRRRVQDRGEEMRRVQEEMATSGATEFELAQANVKALETALIEENDRITAAIKKGWADTGDFIAQTFESLLFNANTTFKDIAIAFGRMVFSILMDATNVRQTIGDLLKKGFQAAVGALGGTAGTGGGAGSAAGAITQSEFASSVGQGSFGQGSGFSFGGARAEGGPIMPEKFYTVGERGETEILGPGISGQVYTQEQWASMDRRGVTQNFYITTPDAGSFTRSRGEIEATMAAAMQRAMRNA